MTADVDASEPQALATITTSMPCLGSQDNPANALLKALVPDGARTVTLRNARLELTFDFSIQLPESETGEPGLRVQPNTVALTVGSMVLGSSGSGALDAVSDDALRKFGFTAAKVAQVGSDALRPAARGIGAALERMIFESLDLEEEADLKLKLVGVEFDEDRRRGNRRLRFEAFRSDKVCFFKPGGRIVNGRFVSGPGEWICTDPIGTGTDDCPRVNGQDICWRPPVRPKF